MAEPLNNSQKKDSSLGDYEEDVTGKVSQHTDNELAIIKMRKEIWEKAVDTQMHFNEMSHKSRHLGLSFAVAALGLSAVLLSQDIDFVFLGLRFNAARMCGIVILIAAIAIPPIALLDLCVYQKLLRGAVKFGWDLESKKIVPEILHVRRGMTTEISVADNALVPKSDSNYSRLPNDLEENNAGVKGLLKFGVRAHQYILLFYLGGFFVLLLLSGFLLLQSPKDTNTPPSKQTEQASGQSRQELRIAK